MSRYYFNIAYRDRLVRDRVGTQLDGLSKVQKEAVEFGLRIIEHRFNYGIEDPSACSIRVSNEIGLVLTTIPLDTIMRQARHPA
jgi:hypothetical protein